MSPKKKRKKLEDSDHRMKNGVDEPKIISYKDRLLKADNLKIDVLQTFIDYLVDSKDNVGFQGHE